MKLFDYMTQVHSLHLLKLPFFSVIAFNYTQYVGVQETIACVESDSRLVPQAAIEVSLKWLVRFVTPDRFVGFAIKS